MKYLKFVFAVIFCSFFFMNFTNASTTTTTSRVSTQKSYKIVSKVNRLYLDVRGGSKKAKGHVWMYSSHNGCAQKWKFEHAGGGYYYIKAACSGMYLDVQGGSKLSKTPVWQYPKNGTSAQKWKLIDAGGGYHYIKAACSGMYLDVQGGKKASGTPVWQYNFNGSDAQKWYFKPIASTSPVKKRPVRLSAMNKIVRASIFGPTAKGKKVFGHTFNFEQKTRVNINKRTRIKTVYVTLDHHKTARADDKYYFVATFNKNNQLLTWEYKINKGGFLPRATTWINPAVLQRTSKGLSPATIDRLTLNAKRKLNGKNSWQSAAKEIAMIIAKTAASYKN